MSRDSDVLESYSADLPCLVPYVDQEGVVEDIRGDFLVQSGGLPSIVFSNLSFASDNDSESRRAYLYTPMSADCPGGLCTDDYIMDKAIRFLKNLGLEKCYLKLIDNEYYFFERSNENCTHIIMLEKSSRPNKKNLVVWPLNFIDSNGMKWFYLGSGSFNIAYKNVSVNDDDETLAYKIPRLTPLGQTSSYQSIDRCVRVWNTINKEFPAKIYGAGWVAPYIDQRLSILDERHVDALMRWLVFLYNTEGRILVDAFPRDSQGNILNFRVQAVSDKFNIVCIDTDFALKLNNDPALVSQDSLEYWKNTHKKYVNYLSEEVKNKIERTTLALLIVNDLLPDIYLDPADPSLDTVLKEICSLCLTGRAHLLSSSREISSRLLDGIKLAEENLRGKLLYDECALRNEMFVNYAAAPSTQLFNLFESQLNQIVAQFKSGAVEIMQNATLERMSPRNQVECETPSPLPQNASSVPQSEIQTKQRFFQADQERKIEIKPKEKEKTVCCWW